MQDPALGLAAPHEVPALLPQPGGPWVLTLCSSIWASTALRMRLAGGAMLRLCSARVSQLMKSCREFWKSVARARASSSFACHGEEGRRKATRRRVRAGLRHRQPLCPCPNVPPRGTSVPRPAKATCLPRAGGPAEGHPPAFHTAPSAAHQQLPHPRLPERGLLTGRAALQLRGRTF